MDNIVNNAPRKPLKLWVLYCLCFLLIFLGIAIFTPDKDIARYNLMVTLGGGVVALGTIVAKVVQHLHGDDKQISEKVAANLNAQTCSDTQSSTKMSERLKKYAKDQGLDC